MSVNLGIAHISSNRRRNLRKISKLAAIWILGCALLITGAVILLASPIAEFTISQMLLRKGFGPTSMHITRASPSGLNVHDLKLLGGAVAVSELAIDFTWRDLIEGKIDSIRINGFNTRLTWTQDGKISAGPLILFPRPVSQVQTSAQKSHKSTSPPSTSPSIGNLSLANSTISLTLPTREITWSISGKYEESADKKRSANVLLSSEQLSSTLRLNLAGLEQAPFLEQGLAELTYDITNLTLPGLADSVSGNGRFAVQFNESMIRTVNSYAELKLNLPEIKSSTLSVLGLSTSDPLRVIISGSNSRIIQLALDRTQAPQKISIDAAITLENGSRLLKSKVLGWLNAPLDGGVPQNFGIDFLDISGRRLLFPGQGELGIDFRLSNFNGPVAVADGHLSVNASANHPLWTKHLNVKTKGELRLDGSSLSFDLTDMMAEAEDLIFANVRALGTNRIALAPKNGQETKAQKMDIIFGNGITVATEFTLSALAPHILQADAASSANAISIKFPYIAVRGYLNQNNDGRINGNLSIKPSNGVFDHPLMHFDSINGVLNFDGSALSGDISWRLSEPPNFARNNNLSMLSTSVKSNVKLSADALILKGQINEPIGQNIGNFEFVRRGIEDPEIRLNIPTRKWDDTPFFFQALGAPIGMSNTVGAFGLDVDVKFKKETVSGSAKFILSNFGFSTDALAVKNINSIISLNQLWPPRAAMPQRLSFDSLMAGLAFSEGNITASVPGDGTIHFDEASMKLANGVVSGRNVTIPLNHNSHDFELRVDNVDIENLVGGFATDGLVASGKLSGRLPIRHTVNSLFLENAYLKGQEGTIIYKPSIPPAALNQGGGEILLQALSNFHFDEIRADLNGEPTQNLAISLSLKGSNPDLYEGHPIEFNLNLDGPLSKLVREGLSGYRIPEDIRQRLEQQGSLPIPN